MAPPPPTPAVPEQRHLAAIVFTDVVGFSARMGSEESATLNLVDRDFAAMRELSTKLSGTVIKTTGDGLLLYFTSAVQAMEWSVQIQKHFAAQARTLPPTEFLRHRVGVHVGDVLVTTNDVMGDGVNIAARVQTEAPTGGICISQAVYDLVKNKMKLDVIRLEPRKLKNISEFIQMYHVLLEPRTVAVAAPGPVTTRAAPVEQEETSPGRPKLAIVAALLVMAGIAAWLVHSHFEHQRTVSTSQSAGAKFDALLKNNAAPASAAAAKDSPAAPLRGAGSDELKFAERALARPGTAPADEASVQREASASIAPTVAWAIQELNRYTEQRPLAARSLQGATQQTLTVYTRANVLYSASAGGGAVRPMNWEKFSPDQQGAILLSLLHHAAPPPGPEVVRGAGAFAYVHRLPDMARRLLEERRANAR